MSARRIIPRRGNASVVSWIGHGTAALTLILVSALFADSAGAASPIDYYLQDENLSPGLFFQRDEDDSILIDPQGVQTEPGEAVGHAQMQFLEQNTLLPKATSTLALAQLDRTDQINALANEAARVDVDRNVVSRGARNGEGLSEHRFALENEVAGADSHRGEGFRAKLYGEELEERYQWRDSVNDVSKLSPPLDWGPQAK